MSQDSDYSLVIWDGKSKGSYNNILRAFEQKKPVKVFLTQINDFLPQEKVTPNEIRYIFYENNGYTAKEVVEFLMDDGCKLFKDTRALHKYLLENHILTKEDGVYQPIAMKDLFLVEKHKGKISGVKFKNSFIDWVRGIPVPNTYAIQDSLFE